MDEEKFNVSLSSERKECLLMLLFVLVKWETDPARPTNVRDLHWHRHRGSCYVVTINPKDNWWYCFCLAYCCSLSIENRPIAYKKRFLSQVTHRLWTSDEKETLSWHKPCEWNENRLRLYGSSTELFSCYTVSY